MPILTENKFSGPKMKFFALFACSQYCYNRNSEIIKLGKIITIDNTLLYIFIKILKNSTLLHYYAKDIFRLFSQSFKQQNIEPSFKVMNEFIGKKINYLEKNSCTDTKYTFTQNNHERYMMQFFEAFNLR